MGTSFMQKQRGKRQIHTPQPLQAQLLSQVQLLAPEQGQEEAPQLQPILYDLDGNNGDNIYLYFEGFDYFEKRNTAWTKTEYIAIEASGWQLIPIMLAS